MTPPKGKSTKSPKAKSEGKPAGEGDKEKPKTQDQLVAEAIKKSGGKYVRSV